MEKNDSQWSPVRADGKAGGRTDLRLEMGEGAHRALILSYFTGASSARDLLLDEHVSTQHPPKR